MPKIVAPEVEFRKLLATLVRDLLGIDLAKTEVGGRLGCTEGAELVF